MRRVLTGIILAFLCGIVLPWQGYAGQKVEIDYPATTVIKNLTLTTADTEYSYALPAKTSKFLIQCRTAFDMKLSWTSGESGTVYITIKADTWYFENGVAGTLKTIYLQSSEAAVVAEIISWDN